MSSLIKRFTAGLNSNRNMSVLVVLSGLSFGAYAISQGAIRAQFLSRPLNVSPVAGGTGSAGAVAREGMGMWNLIGNHIAGAPVFALFVISLSGFLTLRWDSALTATLSSVLISLAAFAGAIRIYSFGAIPSPQAYFGAAILLGILYGGLGVGGGIVARAVQ